MACRSPMNWRGARSAWRNSPRPEPRSRRGPRNASTVSRPSMRPGLRHATPRPRRLAGSPGASRPSRRSPAQVNLTDEQSRIMPVPGGGFEQCCNAQAVVAAGSLLVVAADVVQAANDKRQLAPMLDKLAALPEDLGQPETLLADTGYFSGKRHLDPT